MRFISKQINRRIRRTLIFSILKNVKRYFSYNDNEDNLIYIHIGKCGGSSLGQAINESEIIKKRFKKITTIHLSKPPILKKARYLIVIRDPIERSLSAFNWRYKNVVEGSLPKGEYIKDYKVLKKYGSLNNLADCLYINGNLNLNVAKEFKTIRQLNEDITFYLEDLIKKIKKEQIFCVLSQETLNEDIKKYLGNTTVSRINENSKHTDLNKKHLTANAIYNLKMFLYEDYEIINRLLEINCKPSESREDFLW